RWIMAAVMAVGTFGLAVPAHARMSTVNVTAAQCKSGGGNVYAGKCHGGTWDGKEVRGLPLSFGEPTESRLPAAQRLTMGQVNVRVTPSVSCIRETTILPRSSILSASTW